MSTEVSIFEQAAKNKLRFASTKGDLTTENLFELSLDSLDTLAKGVNRQLKAQAEESFLPTAKTTGNKELELKLELLKHVIAVKDAAEKAAKSRQEKRAQLATLKDIQARKATEALSSTSLEDLGRMIAELEAAA